jgi:16S rRNA pseudouridine516 synthase
VSRATRRVDQLLSSLGSCSRKEARALCARGRVTVDGQPVKDAAARVVPAEVRLDGEDEPTLPARLEVLGERRARVTLSEGRYHQVRRMFAACGLHVEALKRTRFGDWTLGDLPEGEWKALPLP